MFGQTKSPVKQAGRVCEKLAQNVAQPMFLHKLKHINIKFRICIFDSCCLAG
jgi:hypothetical protein